MSGWLRTPVAIRAELQAVLGAPPSPGLMTLVTDLCRESRLGLRFGTLEDPLQGASEINPDGITVGLPCGSVSEAMVAHELAHVLLEVRGWPRLFGSEAGDHWLRQGQIRLVEVVDHAAGRALQLAYGIDCLAHEAQLLAAAAAPVNKLLAQADLIANVALTGEQLMEFNCGLALTLLDHFWRTGTVPDEFFAAADLVDGTRDLFTRLIECAPEGVPQQGWAARRLMATLAGTMDDFFEEEAAIRPFFLLSHFVPARHEGDRARPVDQVATLVTRPLAPEGNLHLITVIPHRDGLPFSFRQTLRPQETLAAALDRLGRERFGSLIRPIVPAEYLQWTPTGPSL